TKLCESRSHTIVTILRSSNQYQSRDENGLCSKAPRSGDHYFMHCSVSRCICPRLYPSRTQM
ncbi:unnamed protein product, partial [Allacma fusca]